MSGALSSPAALLDFHGKVAVVTGAGSGIGSGIARRFAEAGASLVACYRTSRDGAEAVVAHACELGLPAIAVQADVSKEEDVERLFDVTVRQFGAVDVLINNAGSYPVQPLVEITARDWDAVQADNLRSLHLCTRAAARRMIAAGRGGAIVNIASIEAENPAPGHSHYCAAKAAVVMYTRTAAQELGPSGIRVNCVSPGLIDRPGLEQAWPEGVRAYRSAVPLGRLGSFDDVADACLFLASPAARWITGANLVVDGGVLTHRVY